MKLILVLFYVIMTILDFIMLFHISLNKFTDQLF